MQNNFRCAESVIDFTNMLFDKIMPEDYTESDKLIFSKLSDNKIQAPVKMLFYNTFSEKLSSEMCQITEAEQLLEEIKSGMFKLCRKNVHFKRHYNPYTNLERSLSS